MEVNPYDPPTTDALATDPDIPPSRPLGISILAVLHGLGGILLGTLLIVIANATDNEQYFDQTGLPYAWFAVISTLFVLLALASSVGMWRGAKWAWWLAALYYFSMLFGNICQLLLMVPLKARVLDYEAILVLAVRQGGAALINFGLLQYLFKDNVLRFFGLRQLRKLRALGILFGVTVAFVAAIAVITVVHFLNRRA